MKITKLFVLFFLTSLLLLSCNYNLTKTSLTNFDKLLLKFNDPTSDKILIAAHRAMHTKYPENSLAAFQHSIDSGIDIIETDFRTSKDGKIVLLHDDSVDRTTNGKGKVKDFTYSQLQKLELRKNDNDTNTYRIPLAEDAFKLALGEIIIDLDIKDVSIKDLVNLVHKTNVEKQVLFFDSDFTVLDSVVLLDSTLLLMPRAYSLVDVRNIVKKYHPKVIHIDPSFYTKEVVSTIKKSGARVWINALGSVDKKAAHELDNIGYSQLTKRGANVIQTDYPLMLQKYLTKKKLR